MYKTAYLDLKDKFELLKEESSRLRSKLGKAVYRRKALETEVSIQKVMLKRISRESELEFKGWIMSDYEKELETGWVCFKVPEEPEIIKQESPSKFLEKIKVEEDSEIDEEITVIVKKKRTEPPPLLPEVEDAKRLLHVLFKNPKLIWPFEDPVDPVSLNIPDYPQIVKNPMDIGTIRKRLHEGYYNEYIEGFVIDIRTVFMNAAIYNDPFHQIHKLAIQCSNIFEKKLDKSKPITPPLPLGLGRSSRWRQGIAWRRATGEQVICWRGQKIQKIQTLARNPFKE
jgi:Bromodomain